MYYVLRGHAASIGGPMLDLWECEGCGAVVFNKVAHDNLHTDLDRTSSLAAMNQTFGQGI